MNQLPADWGAGVNFDGGDFGEVRMMLGLEDSLQPTRVQEILKNDSGSVRVRSYM